MQILTNRKDRSLFSVNYMTHPKTINYHLNGFQVPDPCPSQNTGLLSVNAQNWYLHILCYLMSKVNNYYHYFYLKIRAMSHKSISENSFYNCPNKYCSILPDHTYLIYRQVQEYINREKESKKMMSVARKKHFFLLNILIIHIIIYKVHIV